MALTSPQAGVDLGTVVKQHEDAVRTAKKGGSKKGGSARQRQAALEQAASGVQIRPKRRMPVSKVRAQHVRIFLCKLTVCACSPSCHCHASSMRCNLPTSCLPIGAAGRRRHTHARHPPLCAQHDRAGCGRVCGRPRPGALLLSTASRDVQEQGLCAARIACRIVDK